MNLIKNNEKLTRFFKKNEIKKVIFVKNRLINILIDE